MYTFSTKNCGFNLSISMQRVSFGCSVDARDMGWVWACASLPEEKKKKISAKGPERLQHLLTTVK